MIVTTLIAAGAALTLTAAYAVATRAAGQVALAGEDTVVGLQDAAAETLADGGKRSSRLAEWQLATVTDLSAAEDMLDCLEMRGIAERELVVLGNSCFAVRWR